MDDNAVPKEDPGSYVYETYPTELYAELFAFMGFVDPDPKARNDWGRRARRLLMSVIDRAKPGVGAGDTPFRASLFSTGASSRLRLGSSGTGCQAFSSRSNMALTRS